MSSGKLSKRRRRSEADIANTSSLNRNRSASSPSLYKKRTAANLKKGDTDGTQHKERRADRAERASAAGAKKNRQRANAITSRSTRDRSDAITATVNPSATRQRAEATTADNTGRQRSDAITSREGARGPDRRDLTARPIAEASDGTALWDGSTAPELSESIVKDVLKNQKPRYDIGKGRMVYPTETSPGVIEYLPLADDATEKELNKGIFVSIVPEQSLTDFVKEKLSPEEFEVEGGKVKAISVQDVKNAFEAESKLVLRSQRYLDSLAETNEVLQQKWV